MRTGARAGRFFVILLTLCSALIMVAPGAAQDPTVVDRQLSLQIDTANDTVAPGGETSVLLTATNTGAEPIEAVSLHLHDAPGVAWSQDFNGPWVKLGDMKPGESRVLNGRVRVAGPHDDNAVTLFATLDGRDAAPTEAQAQLFMPAPPSEESTVDARGGAVEAADGRVEFDFPPDWNETAVELTFQLREETPLRPDETGRLLLFDVSAVAGDTAVDAFDRPVTVEVTLADLLDPVAAAARPPVVAVRPDEATPWTAVKSDFDAKSGVLTFTTTHFSTYQVTSEPELWRLRYNPPGASPYSGAATYQYPVELPPGIAGLTPDLTLSYSSRPAEGMRAPAMSQGFGAGWGLPQAQINNGNAGNFYNADATVNTNYDANAFTLVLNGMNYYLNPLNTTGRYGTFKAIGAPDLFIEYVADGSGANDTANVSGEFWRVKTADGTTYTFGKTEDAEQVIWPMEVTPLTQPPGPPRNEGQFRNPKFAPYNWKLNSIVDVHGNKIEYVYETACGTQFNQPYNPRGENRADTGVFQCTEVDTAVTEIRYNFNGATAQTKLTFTNQAQNSGPKKQEKSMTAGVLRPAQLDITQGGALAGRYTFAYTGGAHNVSAWAVSTEFWLLTGVTRVGSNGSATLPAQTFTYGRDVTDGCSGGACVRLLTEVANGYGAVTALSYADWAGTRWQHVTQTETWDGVIHKKGVQAQGQTRVTYDRSGATACFDTSGSGCTMGTAPPSDALVGFDKVSTEIKAPAGGTSWTTVARSETDFNNADYLLLGKTSEQRQIAPGTTTVLVKDVYSWATVTSGDGNFKDDRLNSESHTLNPGPSALSYSINYTYETLNPPGGSYGALKTKLERDEAGADFRCTEYAYAHRTGDAWLVNRPIRETVKAPGCAGAKQAETLYRYAESTNPTVIGLDTRARLTYTLAWDGTNYVTEKRTYTALGLPHQVYTFASTSTTGAYATDTRNTVTYAYNALGVPTSITTTATGATTQTETLTYDATFPWRVASVADSNQITTRYGYDLFGRLSKVALPGDTLGAPTISHVYSDGAAPWKIETSYKNTIRSAERRYYDGLGRLVQSQTDDAAVQGTGTRDFITTTAYDARGLAVCQTVPYAVAAGSNAFQTATCASQANTTTAYDALGRVTSVTTPDGVATNTAYSVATTITVNGHSKFLRTTVYDGNNHAVNRLTDVFGRLALVRELTGNSAPYTNYADTRYSYDVSDNLLAVGTSAPSDTPPGSFLRLTTMHYDALGRKSDMTDPDMGTWAYGYHPGGTLAWQKDSDNQVICFLYDGRDRLLRRAANGTSTSCPTYSGSPSSGSNHLASYTYGTSDAANNIGKPVAVTWGPNPAQNNDSFTYDGEGRLKKQTRLVNNRSFARETTAYDLLDRPTQVKLYTGATAETIDIGYDREGENSLTAGGTQLISNVGFTEHGRPALLDRPFAPDTSLVYYGAAGNFRLNKILHGPEGGTLPDFIYSAYDDAGNLTGFTAGPHSYSYTYDDLNRLLTVTGAIGRGYTYDRLGNFNSVTRAGVQWVYGYAAGNPSRLMSVSHLPLTVNATGGYDNRGNLAKYTKGGVAYELTFDAENRLSSVKAGSGTPTVFAYDAGGRRVMTTYPDGTIIYTPFPDYEFEDPPGTGADTTRTTYRLAGQIVAVQHKVGAAAGTFYFTYGDHLGNIAGLSYTGGTFLSSSTAWYDPFGTFTTTPGTNPSLTNHGFTGHRHNNTGTNNLGLIYMNARYYLPEVGRFVSADSIVPEPENPQSHNRYSYSYNDPVNMIDPTGHVAQCWTLDENGSNVSCDEWMIEAMTILGLEGGMDGARLAMLFWQWFHDPDKLLSIYAYKLDSASMYTRQLYADTATIYVGKDVIAGFEPGDITLLGHELEHVSQGTWQAWSIQGEVLAYQVEYRIREAMGEDIVRQTDNTLGAMGQLPPNRPPYSAGSYADLEDARSGFLSDPGEPYNAWYEPNLPWGQEIAYRAWQSELVRSLIVNSPALSGRNPR